MSGAGAAAEATFARSPATGLLTHSRPVRLHHRQQHRVRAGRRHGSRGARRVAVARTDATCMWPVRTAARLPSCAARPRPPTDAEREWRSGDDDDRQELHLHVHGDEPWTSGRRRPGAVGEDPIDSVGDTCLAVPGRLQRHRLPAGPPVRRLGRHRADHRRARLSRSLDHDRVPDEFRRGRERRWRERCQPAGDDRQRASAGLHRPAMCHRRRARSGQLPGAKRFVLLTTLRRSRSARRSTRPTERSRSSSRDGAVAR